MSDLDRISNNNISYVSQLVTVNHAGRPTWKATCSPAIVLPLRLEVECVGVWAVVFLMMLAVGGASCSEDPETAKRRLLDEGNSYMASKKYSEAIISYRNAIESRRKVRRGPTKAGRGVPGGRGRPQCTSRIGSRRRPDTRQR